MRAIITLAAALMAGPAAAAIDCRMPNGKTITFRTATQCPADAAQVDASGKVIRPAGVQPPTPAPAPATPPPAAAAPAGPSAYDAAHVLCDLLRQRGAASECKVDSHILTTSTIDITTNESPRTAWSTCVTMAAELRKAAPDFRAKNWQIRLFSPFSGARPIASCDI